MCSLVLGRERPDVLDMRPLYARRAEIHPSRAGAMLLAALTGAGVGLTAFLAYQGWRFWRESRQYYR